ncbi:hypothetical protein [Corallococcus sp. 4LFB]
MKLKQADKKALDALMRRVRQVVRVLNRVRALPKRFGHWKTV